MSIQEVILGKWRTINSGTLTILYKLEVKDYEILVSHIKKTWWKTSNAYMREGLK